MKVDAPFHIPDSVQTLTTVMTCAKSIPATSLAVLCTAGLIEE